MLFKKKPRDGDGSSESGSSEKRSHSFSFFGLFKHKSHLEKSLKKVEKVTEADKRREKLQEQLFRPHMIRKKKAPRKRYPLQRLLVRAGVELAVTDFWRLMVRISFYCTLVLSLFLFVLLTINKKSFFDIMVVQVLGVWILGFALISMIIALGTMVFLDIRIHKRREELEKVLPDYLQLVAANIGAGMTIDRALWYAVRPRFGVLAKEIEDVAKRVLTGEDLDKALMIFVVQYDSMVLKRSISLLLEGLAAGGKIAELLAKISVDIQEQRILRQEMAANVMTYVIFISFAAVGAAPVLFGLSTQLLIIIQTIAGNLGAEASSGSFSVSGDVIKLFDFRVFCISVLVVTSTMSSFIISTIRSGNLMEALRYLPIFLVTSISLYVLSSAFFGLLFGGIL